MTIADVNDPFARHIHDAVRAAATTCHHTDPAGPTGTPTRGCAGCTTDAVLVALTTSPGTLDHFRHRYVTVRPATAVIRGHHHPTHHTHSEPTP